MYPENNQPAQGFPQRPPYLQPPQPYAQPPARSNRRLLFILAGVAVALLIVGVGTVVVLRTAGAGRFKDSGVTACEAIRDRSATAASSSKAKLTEAQYRELRTAFADSRHADLRDSGTTFADLLWQFTSSTAHSDSSNTGELGLTSAAFSQLFESYTALSAACANHGVALPLLPAN